MITPFRLVEKIGELGYFDYNLLASGTRHRNPSTNQPHHSSDQRDSMTEQTISDLLDLSGKVAIVTGAAGLLGAAMSRGLAEAGRNRRGDQPRWRTRRRVCRDLARQWPCRLRPGAGRQRRHSRLRRRGNAASGPGGCVGQQCLRGRRARHRHRHRRRLQPGPIIPA